VKENKSLDPKSINACRALTSRVNQRGIAPKETKGGGFGWRKPRPELIRQDGCDGAGEVLMAEGFGKLTHTLWPFKQESINMASGQPSLQLRG
jgi:hypothetical protein